MVPLKAWPHDVPQEHPVAKNSMTNCSSPFPPFGSKINALKSPLRKQDAMHSTAAFLSQETDRH